MRLSSANTRCTISLAEIVSLNIQTACLGLGRESIGNFDRDLHRKLQHKAKSGGEYFSDGDHIDFA